MKLWWIWTAIAILVFVLVSSSDSSPSSSVSPKQPSIQSSSKEIKSSAPVVDSEPKCHLSYSGCLKPDASDYDCAGGSGNGPYYTGKVRVIGPDVFGLDRDRDGWGCE